MKNFRCDNFEWLDGYWTAIKHVSSLGNWGSPVEWVAAIGSVGAAFAAALAAAQSLKAAKQSNAVMTENERSAVIQQAVSIYHDAQKKAQAVVEIASATRDPTFPNDMSQEKRDFLSDLDSDFGAYQRCSSRASDSIKVAISAIGMVEISKVKRELTFISSDMRTVDLMFENRTYMARRKRLIPE